MSEATKTSSASDADHDSRTASTESEKVPAVETQRVLAGFMSPAEAVQRLVQLEQSLEEEKPMADSDAEGQQTREEELREGKQEVWSQANDAIGEPAASFQASDVELRDLPDNDAIQAHLDEFLRQDGTELALEGLEDEQWAFKLVPLKSLVAVQPSVTTTAYQDIPTWDDDPLATTEYCFPPETENSPMVQQYRSDDDNVFRTTAVSRSPNFGLRQQVVEPTEDGAVIKVRLANRPNFVQVALYKNRLIVKNGYHRTFQMLRAGGEYVPALVRDTELWEETGGAKPHFFTENQVVMTDRPPMVADFLTDAAVETEKRATNKVIELTVNQRDIVR